MFLARQKVDIGARDTTNAHKQKSRWWRRRRRRHPESSWQTAQRPCLTSALNVERPSFLPSFPQVCASLAVGALALALSVVGARCTSFLRHDWPAKNRVGLLAGVAFVAAGVLCVIPVSLSAHAIVTGFFDPLPSEERRGELGASIYVGWTSAALLVIGGVLVCSVYRC